MEIPPSSDSADRSNETKTADCPLHVATWKALAELGVAAGEGRRKRQGTGFHPAERGIRQCAESKRSSARTLRRKEGRTEQYMEGCVGSGKICK